MPSDLDAFFDPADGLVVLCVRSRLLTDDNSFHALPGLADREVFDGHGRAPLRTIAYAAGPDVRPGDEITISVIVGSDPGLSLYAGAYSVQDVELVNDGQEARAQLKLIAAP
jgi:hypothetical protein